MAREATHMQYRWIVRAIRVDGSSVLFPQSAIKKEARLTAQRLLADNADFAATVVVDGWDELPNDRRYDAPALVEGGSN